MKFDCFVVFCKSCVVVLIDATTVAPDVFGNPCFDLKLIQQNPVKVTFSAIFWSYLRWLQEVWDSVTFHSRKSQWGDMWPYSEQGRFYDHILSFLNNMQNKLILSKTAKLQFVFFLCWTLSFFMKQTSHFSFLFSYHFFSSIFHNINLI